MPSRSTVRTLDVYRTKLLWALASAMVVAQLGAFWALCSNQVRQAQIRDATTQVLRTAVADCLRYVPGATLSSCAAVSPLNRGASAVAVAHQSVLVNTAAPDAATRPVPVNYVYR